MAARKRKEPEVVVKPSRAVGMCSLCHGRVSDKDGRVVCENCKGIPVSEHGPLVVMRPSTPDDR